LPTKSGVAQAAAARTRAEASFKKEERAREGAQAMMEYQASTQSAREQMARLRELRLAKEAADNKAAAAKVAEGVKKVAAKVAVKAASKRSAARDV